MALKTKYDLSYDNPIAANTADFQVSGVVPSGRTVRLLNFGGYEVMVNDGLTGIIALQWGNGTTWKTVRAGGGGFFDINFLKGKDFLGDGVKQFRLVRQNKSAVEKILAAWLVALVV